MYKLNPIHYNNIKQGIKTEKMIFEVMKQKWNITQLEKTFQFHVYYEIKSRNNNYDKYPTTMVGLNKIEYIKKHNLECIFVFVFTDGNYYYEYNNDDELIINNGGRNDRGKAEYKQYAYILINKLNKI